MDVGVVLPTYQEHETIGGVLEDVADRLLRNYELIVVDDSPGDRTANAVRDADVDATLIRRGASGLGTAVARGIEEATAECVVVMDADGQHPPRQVPTLADHVDAGADMVVGSRHVGGSNEASWGIGRYLMSAGASALAWALVPDSRPLQDPMSGFFAVRRSQVTPVLDELEPQGYKIALEVLARAPIRTVSEVPIAFQPRSGGESNTDSGEIANYLQHLSTLAVVSRRKQRPRRVGTVARPEVSDERP